MHNPAFEENAVEIFKFVSAMEYQYFPCSSGWTLILKETALDAFHNLFLLTIHNCILNRL